MNGIKITNKSVFDLREVDFDYFFDQDRLGFLRCYMKWRLFV